MAKRESGDSEQATLNAAGGEPVSALATLTPRLAALTLAADRDKRKLPDLKKFFMEHPDIFDQVSLIPYTIHMSIIRKIVGEDKEGSVLALEGEYEALIEKLACEDDTPIERLMIERIGMSWLRVLCAEAVCGILMGNSRYMRDLEIADHLLTRAHNRYLRACESLVRTRKLLAQARAINAHAGMDRSIPARSKSLTVRPLKASA